MKATEDPFGPVIYKYTSDQAIDDGLLCHPYPDKFPGWCFTAKVHAALEIVADDRNVTYAQVAIPLLMDAAMIVRARPGDHLYTKGLEGNATGSDLWIGQNDIGGFTIMDPSDY